MGPRDRLSSVKTRSQGPAAKGGPATPEPVGGGTGSQRRGQGCNRARRIPNQILHLPPPCAAAGWRATIRRKGGHPVTGRATGVIPEGGQGGRVRPASGRGAGMHGVRGCLGRRTGPGTWLPPRSPPPRAPLAPLLFSLRNSLRRPDVAWRAAAWASRWRSSRGTRPRAGAGGRPGAPTGSRTGSGAQLPPRAPSTPPTPRPPRSPSGGRAGCPPPLPQGGQGGGGECQQLLGHEGVQAVPRPGVGEAVPLPLLSPLLLL